MHLLTKCTIMQDPELPMRPLQNHLPLLMHLTTHAGLCTPQYLHAQGRASSKQEAPQESHAICRQAMYENMPMEPETQKPQQPELLLKLLVWVGAC